jgi:putative hemolysin
MEVGIIFLLTLVNAIFALGEISLVSLKRQKIEQLAADGNKNAKIILELLEQPDHFLSSVQVGITLIGIFSGAYGGATLSDKLAKYLEPVIWLQPYTKDVSFLIVIGGITYFSIVVGELVPKSLAMSKSEKIALILAPFIKFFTKATYPFVKLLAWSTNLILRLFGFKEGDGEKITEDELRFMIKTASTQGVLHKEESEVHQNLFGFSDQIAKSLMTHRRELEWIDLEDSQDEILSMVQKSAHSKFPVAEGNLDEFLGIVSVKDILEANEVLDQLIGDRKVSQLVTEETFKSSLKKMVREPIYLPENMTAFRVLNMFKREKSYHGMVVDEFGSIIGLISLHDIMEAILGDLPDLDEVDPDIVKRQDGSFLVDGSALISDLNAHLGEEVIELLPSEYTTVSGFLVSHLNRIPAIGTIVDQEHWTFEVIDMDGRKIDKVLIKKVVH